MSEAVALETNSGAPPSGSLTSEVFEITCFQGEVSAEAAGIIATLFALSHLSFRYPSDRLAHGYGRLHRYVDGHPEASEIYQAID